MNETEPTESAALHARAKGAEALAAHQAVLVVVGMLGELLAISSLKVAHAVLAGAIKKRLQRPFKQTVGLCKSGGQ
ncbi:MAG: hypothetical protein AB8B63_01960 [Granulosicoccus sp.]